jgi:hypothetical protein
LTLVFGFAVVSGICSPEASALKAARGAQLARQSASRGAVLLIVAADSRLDQFTVSGPVLKPGVCREFERHKRGYRAGRRERSI